MSEKSRKIFVTIPDTSLIPDGFDEPGKEPVRYSLTAEAKGGRIFFDLGVSGKFSVSERDERVFILAIRKAFSEFYHDELHVLAERIYQYDMQRTDLHRGWEMLPEWIRAEYLDEARDLLQRKELE